MTDATHPVTQSAVEAITREYLKGLGGTIREDGHRWHVRLPAHVDVDFTDNREFEIALRSEELEEDETVSVLTPASEFTQQVLDGAAEMAAVGQVSLTNEIVNGAYQYPQWITESDAEVDSATFNPYYDKTAICVFVKVSVETVSEYQTQFLEAVTLDVESKERLPNIADILLNEFYSPKGSPPFDVPNDEEVSIRIDELKRSVAVGQELAVEGIQGDISAIRESASRSADSEFEEYRQLQEQQINDLQNEISSLSDRLQRLAADVDEAESQQQRVEALEKRRELKEEKETSEKELSEILQKKENGYAQKQREIYERHAIEVNTKPIALTVVNYERGELSFELSQRNHTATVRTPYAVGAGVLDEVECKNCEERLSGANPIQVSAVGVCCRNCR